MNKFKALKISEYNVIHALNESNIPPLKSAAEFSIFKKVLEISHFI